MKKTGTLIFLILVVAASAIAQNRVEDFDKSADDNEPSILRFCKAATLKGSY